MFVERCCEVADEARLMQSQLGGNNPNLTQSMNANITKVIEHERTELEILSHEFEVQKCEERMLSNSENIS